MIKKKGIFSGKICVENILWAYDLIPKNFGQDSVVINFGFPYVFSFGFSGLSSPELYSENTSNVKL